MKTKRGNTEHNKKFQKHIKYPFIADLYNVRDNKRCNILIVNVNEADDRPIVYFITDPDDVSCSICSQV